MEIQCLSRSWEAIETSGSQSLTTDHCLCFFKAQGLSLESSQLFSSVENFFSIEDNVFKSTYCRTRKHFQYFILIVSEKLHQISFLKFLKFKLEQLFRQVFTWQSFWRKISRFFFFFFALTSVSTAGVPLKLLLFWRIFPFVPVPVSLFLHQPLVIYIFCTVFSFTRVFFHLKFLLHVSGVKPQTRQVRSSGNRDFLFLSFFFNLFHQLLHLSSLNIASVISLSCLSLWIIN